MLSPSSRRAWIEILYCGSMTLPGSVALLAEGVDRNRWMAKEMEEADTSPSSRRAWIEILFREL